MKPSGNLGATILTVGTAKLRLQGWGAKGCLRGGKAPGTPPLCGTLCVRGAAPEGAEMSLKPRPEGAAVRGGTESNPVSGIFCPGVGQRPQSLSVQTAEAKATSASEAASCRAGPHSRAGLGRRPAVHPRASDSVHSDWTTPSLPKPKVLPPPPPPCPLLLPLAQPDPRSRSPRHPTPPLLVPP